MKQQLLRSQQECAASHRTISTLRTSLTEHATEHMQKLASVEERAKQDATQHTTQIATLQDHNKQVHATVLNYQKKGDTTPTTTSTSTSTTASKHNHSMSSRVIRSRTTDCCRIVLLVCVVRCCVCVVVAVAADQRVHALSDDLSKLRLAHDALVAAAKEQQTQHQALSTQVEQSQGEKQTQHTTSTNMCAYMAVRARSSICVV